MAVEDRSATAEPAAPGSTGSPTALTAAPLAVALAAAAEDPGPGPRSREMSQIGSIVVETLLKENG